ncbi:DUF2399 domain-containing protein [Streptomyces sp. V4I2]|uniref:DUF2399 domain-containing protein n=1 Tax=Streptomyces sp. V4I2 TaxID=3042280 RepID=UPI0027D7DE3F|nr:DUF2399 domain-containing protein [Streptomyces sp. V4I2]
MISTSRATSVAKELCRSVHRIAKGRGAQGERGRLAGPPAVGPWDPELARAMEESGRTVMEERLLPALLSDLTRT